MEERHPLRLGDTSEDSEKWRTHVWSSDVNWN